jgi:PPM family protein phosphatase
MIKYAGKSRKGSKSRENEDNFTLPEGNGIFKIEPDFCNKGYLFLVCDGMGGHNAGEVASSLCANWFWQDYYNEDVEISNLSDWLKQEIISLNSRLFNLSAENAEYRGMGTTLVGIIIRESTAYSFSVGDSRCYLLTGKDFRQLTEDDSEVWQLFKQGFIKKDEIITNRRKHMITKAIAIKPTVEFHIYEPFNLPDDFTILLCSDGVHDVLVDKDIEHLLRKKSEPAQICDEVIKLSLSKKSKDDITLIVIKK